VQKYLITHKSILELEKRHETEKEKKRNTNIIIKLFDKKKKILMRFNTKENYTFNHDATST